VTEKDKPPDPAPVYPDDYPQAPGWTNEFAVREDPPVHQHGPPEGEVLEAGWSNPRASRVPGQPLVEQAAAARADATAVYLEPGESNARAVRGDDSPDEDTDTEDEEKKAPAPVKAPPPPPEP